MRDMRSEIGAIETADADALIVNLFEGVTRPGGATGAVDRALDGGIERAIASGLVTGKVDRAVVLPTYGRIKASAVVVTGLGPKDRFSLTAARRAAGVAARAARKGGAKRLATIVHGAGAGGLDFPEAVEATALGVSQGLWRYDGYRTEKQPQVESVILYEIDRARKADLEKAVDRANVIGAALSFSREMAVLGSNDKYPERFVARAKTYADAQGLSFEVWDEDKLQQMGAGGILGVGQGSVHPPRIVILRVPGATARTPVLGLVGKGITFDSGGISLKPGLDMEEMKYDMCGAAAVLAAMGALAKLGTPVPVVGILCLAENLPSGSAQRPGDVLRTLDGQTIEVVNTDAEGRLVLSDGLTLARRLGATHLADAATLTGACVVALGHAYTGLMASDDRMATAVERAAARGRERVWRLPIDDPEYERLIESDVADMKNSGGRWGGALTAAALLRRFTAGLPWAHLDIAGTAWVTDEEIVPHLGAGPTGAAVETFIHLPEALYSA